MKILTVPPLIATAHFNYRPPHEKNKQHYTCMKQDKGKPLIKHVYETFNLNN